MAASAGKGATFPSDWMRYADPDTELQVYRLTDPAYSSALPAYYNRAVSRDGSFLLYSCERAGTPQAFRMDLKSGATRQLTEAGDLDGRSLTLLPDDRGFCYFAGRNLCVSAFVKLAERVIYSVPPGWERGAGLNVSPDGTRALFVERQGGVSRLRLAPMPRGELRTVVETPFEISDPVARSRKPQVLYRQSNTALWLTSFEGKPARQLKTAPGGIGPATWNADGSVVLYLSFPEDRSQLNAIREYSPETDTDKLVAKTSQYAHFGFNRNATVFVGASRNAASPDILIMLRVNGRELTLCEHKASRPETVAPVFSPDAQRIYFQSDRSGKPAIYCVHVERLVEKIQEDAPQRTKS